MFDIMREPIRITKPIRLIELFAGYGSQAMALRNIGAQFEHYSVVEFDKYAIASYNAVHVQISLQWILQKFMRRIWISVIPGNTAIL